MQIDSRAGKRTGGGIAVTEGTENVGQPLTDQFLVRVKALTGLGGDGFGNGNGFHKSEQRDDGGIGQEPPHDGQIDFRDGDARQAGRHDANHAATADHGQTRLVQAPVPDL